MQTAVAGTFLLGLPAVAFFLIWCAKRLLIHTIPKSNADVTGIRTDLYSMRAAYAAFIVGLILLVSWAIGVTVVGCATAVKTIWSGGATGVSVK